MPTLDLGSSPRIIPLTAAFDFKSLDVDLDADNVQWLYNFIMFAFKGFVDSQVRAAIEDELNDDVPRNLNNLLSTVPASFAVKGLPFAAEFGYSILTRNFVRLEGYNSIGLKPEELE